MMTDAALWARLTAFELDNGEAEFPFSARLARENGWTRRFAKRAIEEYKRFVYLAMVSPGGDVTPSDSVDQVWHLHLTYTRSYWDEMCGKVLGCQLHHGPTKGGRNEDRRYRIQYEKTLTLYEREFGHLPPTELWPDENERFAGVTNQCWVDKRRYWFIPKPKRLAALSAAIFVSALMLTSAGSAFAGTAKSSGGNRIFGLILFGALAAFVLVSSVASRKTGKKKTGGSCGSGCGSGMSGSSDNCSESSSGDCGDGGSGCGGCGGCGG